MSARPWTHEDVIAALKLSRADRFYHRYFNTIKVLTTCYYCKKQFAIVASEQKRGYFHFCSEECDDAEYGQSDSGGHYEKSSLKRIFSL